MCTCHELFSVVERESDISDVMVYPSSDYSDGTVYNNNTNNNKSRRKSQSVQEFVDNSFALDRKIKEACKGLMPESHWLIKLKLESDEDKELLADFIL